MAKAVFLDRDGTINEEVDFLKRIEDIKIIDGVPQALRRFKQLGFLNIITSNQSGVARGYFTIEELNRINTEILSQLKQFYDEELIDAVYFSPFHPEGIIPEYSKSSDCRKPGTGLIDKAVREFGINTESSFFIGDSYVDMLCADRAGLCKILLKTGYGLDAYNKCIEDNLQIDFFAENILSSTAFIESKIKSDKIDTHKS